MTPKHGKRARYQQGCRCPECVAANTTYFRAYRSNGVGAVVTRIHTADPVFHKLSGRVWGRRPDGPPVPFCGTRALGLVMPMVHARKFATACRKCYR